MSKNKYFQSLIISLVLHLVLAIGVYFQPEPPLHPPVTVPIEVQFDQSPKTPTQQVVTDPEWEDLEKRLQKQARHLSRVVRRVKKETKARHSGLTKNRPQSASSSQKTPLPPKNADRAKPSHSKGIPFDPLGPLPPAPSSKKLWNLSQQERLARQWALGPSTVSEHLPHVDEAEFTALNTDQFTFYTFYRRINEQIRPRWVTHIRNTTRQLTMGRLRKLSRQPRVTEVEIVLNQKGEFLQAFLHKTSGLKGLDQAAINAFKEASPLVNPPTGMVSDDGLIHLKYGFVVRWKPTYLVKGLQGDR